MLAAFALLAAAGCDSESHPAQTAAQVSGTSVSASGIDYVGDGTQTLGSLNLPKGADVAWSCAGCATFRLEGTDNHQPNGHFFWTQAPSGSGHLPPGEYTLEVRSDGHWTLSLNTSAKPSPVLIALAASPASLRTGCRRAARRLNIAIYCPTLVPAGWAATHLCAGCNGTFSATGWFPAPPGYVGTPGEPTGHFTVWAARRRFIRDGYVGCTNATPLGRVRVAGRLMRRLRCPKGSTLDSGHVLLQWSRGNWIYALSVHTDSPANRRLLHAVANHLHRVEPT